MNRHNCIVLCVGLVALCLAFASARIVSQQEILCGRYDRNCPACFGSPGCVYIFDRTIQDPKFYCKDVEHVSGLEVKVRGPQHCPPPPKQIHPNFNEAMKTYDNNREIIRIANATVGLRSDTPQRLQFMSSSAEVKTSHNSTVRGDGEQDIVITTDTQIYHGGNSKEKIMIGNLQKFVQPSSELQGECSFSTVVVGGVSLMVLVLAAVITLGLLAVSIMLYCFLKNRKHKVHIRRKPRRVVTDSDSDISPEEIKMEAKSRQKSEGKTGERKKSRSNK